MSFGQIVNRIPHARVSLPGHGAEFEVDFVIDTAFDGELALPSHLASSLDQINSGWRSYQLANGDIIVAPYCEIYLSWDGEPRRTEVAIIDGNPLLGVELLEGNLVQIEMTIGGEVHIEPL